MAPSKLIEVVGASGAGKSTALSLLKTVAGHAVKIVRGLGSMEEPEGMEEAAIQRLQSSGLLGQNSFDALVNSSPSKLATILETLDDVARIQQAAIAQETGVVAEDRGPLALQVTRGLLKRFRRDRGSQMVIQEAQERTASLGLLPTNAYIHVYASAEELGRRGKIPGAEVASAERAAYMEALGVTPGAAIFDASIGKTSDGKPVLNLCTDNLSQVQEKRWLINFLRGLGVDF